MRFARILDAVYSQPWNITPQGWLAVHRLVQSRMFADPSNLSISDFVNPRPDMEIDSNGIAHIHVTGVLGQHLTNIERSCGNTGYEQIAQELDNSLGQGAAGVLLYINSPGGAAAGNTEIALKVASMSIPVGVFTDDLMASAAYAIGASAGHITATPSAQVGSIGTILPLVDESAAWEKEGFKPAYITNTGGDLKDAFWPPSFSEEHRAHFQQVVDDYFLQFRDAVLSRRSVSPEAMRGQTMIGARAREHNLVDRIGSLDTAYAELITRTRRG